MLDRNEDLFTNRKPNEYQSIAMDGLTAGFIAMAQQLKNELPDSRYLSLAMTKLEECSMWAKKGVVFTVGVDND